MTQIRFFKPQSHDEYASTPCPGCAQWRVLDEDMYFGRVSTHCADVANDKDEVLEKGCGWHETVDWSARR